MVDEPRGPEPTTPRPAPLPGVEGVLGPEPVPAAAEEPVERRYPSTIGGGFYILIMLVVGGALTVAAVGDWRLGVKILAGCLASMAGLRLVLRQRDAGMLAVRHRFVDAALLLVCAGVLVFLAVSIPDQPS